MKESCDVKQFSREQLVQLGLDSLKNRLLEQAIIAHRKHGPLTEANLDRFLADSACVRYRTRLVFDLGEMATNQFAQPELDPQDASGKSLILYLRPELRPRMDLASLAVAYMVPVINYGEVVTDENCLTYGAALQGLTTNEFYEQICALADFVGSQPAYSLGP